MFRLFLVFIISIFWGVLPVEARVSTWHEVKNDHFIIYTDGSVYKAKKILERLEEFHGFLLHQLKVDDKLVIPALTLYLVNSRKKYERLTSSKVTGGVFVYSFRGPLAVVSAKKVPNLIDEPMEHVFHEYVHYFMSLYGLDGYPSWYVEGLADYFSTFKVKKKFYEIGAIPKSRAYTLVRARQWSSAATILSSSTRGSRSHSSDMAMFYAQSWMMVSLFMQDPVLIKKFSYYIENIKNGHSAILSFEPTFGVPLSYMDQKMAMLRANGKLTVFRAPKVDILFKAPKVTKLSIAHSMATELAISHGFVGFSRDNRFKAKNFATLIAKAETILKDHGTDAKLNMMIVLASMANRQTKNATDYLAKLKEKAKSDPSYGDALALAEMAYLVTKWERGNQRMDNRMTMSKHHDVIKRMYQENPDDNYLRYLYINVLAHSNVNDYDLAYILMKDAYHYMPESMYRKMMYFEILVAADQRRTACNLIADDFNKSKDKEFKMYLQYKLFPRSKKHVSCKDMTNKVIEVKNLL